MHRLWIALFLLGCANVEASNGRYLTWVDDLGRVHNTFVDSSYGSQQRAAAQRISQADQARMADGTRNTWPGSQSGAESKRRYFTWVDATGNLQSSFYAGAQQIDGQQGLTLPNGQNSSDYIDAEAFEGKGFVRSENGNPYYTWVDENGRMHNSQVTPEQRAAGMRSGAQASQEIQYSEGRQVLFDKRPANLPGLDGQPNEAMKSLLEGSQEKADGLYQGLQDQCCGHLSEGAFTELSVDEPRYQELKTVFPRVSTFPWGAVITRP